MAIFPPGKLEEFVRENLEDRIEEYFRKTILGKEKDLATYFTSSTSSTTSASSWTGSGLTYYRTYTDISYPSSGISAVSKPKVKEPDYIPSDEPSGRKRLEQEFKFNPAFLDMEGEDNVIIG
jgi:hypothetical protein